jgi:uncharacterized SAM-binding protein YcdF (DUF218 family)
MLFISSKLFNTLSNPTIWIILLSLTSILLFFIKKEKLYKISTLALIIIILIVYILPLGSLSIKFLEKNYYNLKIPDNIDGIVVLGGIVNTKLTIEHDSLNFGRNSERLLEMVKIASQKEKIKIIFSGGNNNLIRNQTKEADLIKKYLTEMGIDISNILFENQSRNTYENLVFSKRLVQPKEKENWVLITSAFHMNRSLMIAKKIKWDLKPYPVDFRGFKRLDYYTLMGFDKNFENLKISLHEIIGILFYQFKLKEFIN